MSAFFWGVDSVHRADTPEPAAYTGTKNLFEHLVEKKLEPSFFGRYLRIGGDAFLLTKGEADFLLGKGCRILPVYRGKESPVELEKASQQVGMDAARDAIDRASKLGMPSMVVIYNDIEPGWSPSVAYLIGWCLQMLNSMYGGAGGFYCNNWAFSGFMNKFEKACKEMDGKDGIKDAISLWCQVPLKRCVQIESFEPLKPMFHMNGPKVWQYATRCLPFNQGGKQQGLIDMNVATQDGFDDMWKSN